MALCACLCQIAVLKCYNIVNKRMGWQEPPSRQVRQRMPYICGMQYCNGPITSEAGHAHVASQTILAALKQYDTNLVSLFCHSLG
jgi:hypothetical protein